MLHSKFKSHSPLSSSSTKHRSPTSATRWSSSSSVLLKISFTRASSCSCCCTALWDSSRSWAPCCICSSSSFSEVCEAWRSCTRCSISRSFSSRVFWESSSSCWDLRSSSSFTFSTSWQSCSSLVYFSNFFSTTLYKPYRAGWGCEDGHNNNNNMNMHHSNLRFSWASENRSSMVDLSWSLIRKSFYIGEWDRQLISNQAALQSLTIQPKQWVNVIWLRRVKFVWPEPIPESLHLPSPSNSAGLWFPPSAPGLCLHL